MTISQPIPPPTFPFLGVDGAISQVWYKFFQALYTRTGGAVGAPPSPISVDLTALKAAVADLTTRLDTVQVSISDVGVLTFTTDEVIGDGSIQTQVAAVVAGQIADLQTLVSTAIGDEQIQVVNNVASGPARWNP